MGRKEKQLERLYSRPKDFKWKELKKILKGDGYKEKQGSGSRVKFYLESPRNLIILHKPHPDEILKQYMIDIVIDNMEKAGIIHGND